MLSPTAPRAGFPEDVAKTKAALARGYAVIALDPLDRAHLCWTGNPRRGDDQPLVCVCLPACLSVYLPVRLPA